DGTIAVVDFGAAHVQGMTVGSTAIGTFGYMPLEQLAGEVDATTDLYALGASLLHLLTRREPWRLLQSGLLADADPNVSRRMRAFLARLVAPNPRDRFRSAAEARDALDRLEHGRGPSLRRDRFAGVRWRVPRPVLLASAAAATLMAAGVGAYVVVSEPDRNEAWRARHEALRAAEEARKVAAMMRELRDEARRMAAEAHDEVRFETVESTGSAASGEARSGEPGTP